MERYRNIPPIPSEDREIVDATLGSPAGSRNGKRARFSETIGAGAVYLMDENGWTISTSNWRDPQTFLRQNHGFRPYFKEALGGRSGEFLAVERRHCHPDDP